MQDPRRQTNNPRLIAQQKAKATAAQPDSGDVSAQPSSAVATDAAPAPELPRISAQTVNPIVPGVTPAHNYRSFAEEMRQRHAEESARKFSEEAAPYLDASRYTAKKPKKPVNKLAVVVSLLVVAAIGVGAWFVLNPAHFTVTVDGAEVNANRGDTLSTLLDEGVSSPVPGNLVDVEGVLLETGQGNRFSAKVNGESTANGNQQIHKDDVIVFSQGEDAVEPYTAEDIIDEPTMTLVGEGALHVYHHGTAGKIVRRTGQISGKTTETVESVRADGGLVEYNADTGDQRVIALTFDDGPWPETTDAILDILKANGAKATFFTVGRQIAENEAVVKRAAAEGHQISTHSWDHASGSGGGVDLTLMSKEEQIDEIKKGLEAIEQVTGKPASTSIRVPGGNFSGDLVWNIEPLATAEIGWNVDTEDWTEPGVNRIVEQLQSVRPGSVVLMHDGGGDRSQTIEALSIALPKLVERGYSFVTIDELLAISPVPELDASSA